MSETQRNKPQFENKTTSILYAVHKVVRNKDQIASKPVQSVCARECVLLRGIHGYDEVKREIPSVYAASERDNKVCKSYHQFT